MAKFESFRYPPIRMFFDSHCPSVSFSNGDMLFNMQQPIHLPPDVTAYVSLSELTLPICQTNIDASNELLVITTATGAHPVHLTIGNYTVDSFCTSLTTAIQQAGPTVSCQYSDITGRISFSSAAAFTIMHTSTMYNVIGLQNTATDYPAVLSGQTYSLTADTFCDLSGNNCIFVNSQFQTSNYSWINQTNKFNNGRGSNTLGKIQITGQNGDVLYYLDAQKLQNKIFDKDLGFVHLTLLDESGSIYNQCPLGWSATLDFYFYETPK